MKTTTTTCDRCKGTIEANGSALIASAGPLHAERLDAYDLCAPCTTAFKTWLANEPRGREDGR